MDDLTDRDLRVAFENQSISHPDWNHRCHLRMAYIYLRAHPLEEATDVLRAGIQKLNAAHGVEDSLTRGYHETMTCAWLHLVHFTMAQFGPENDSRSFLDAQPHLGTKTLLRLYYSRPHIVSERAKAEFVAPDLAPFPKSRSSPS